MSELPPLAAFLRARRERTLPRDVGLPVNGRRRTPGLRREEVATLAGVSVDYLVRLEQGRDAHPSADVLVSLADAMRMTDDERMHLYHLGAASNGAAMCPAPATLVREVAPTVLRLVEAMAPTPAFVLGPASDVLAWNEAWATVVRATGILDGPTPNLARYVFLDRRARTTFPQWRSQADEQVGRLRRVSGHWSDDDGLQALLAELRTDAEFEVRWAAHPVAEKRRGSNALAHPVVGTLDLLVEGLDVADDTGQVVVAWLPADEDTAARLDRLLAPPRLRVIAT